MNERPNIIIFYVDCQQNNNFSSCLLRKTTDFVYSYLRYIYFTKFIPVFLLQQLLHILTCWINVTDKHYNVNPCPYVWCLEMCMSKAVRIPFISYLPHNNKVIGIITFLMNVVTLGANTMIWLFTNSMSFLVSYKILPTSSQRQGKWIFQWPIKNRVTFSLVRLLREHLL